MHQQYMEVVPSGQRDFIDYLKEQRAELAELIGAFITPGQEQRSSIMLRTLVISLAGAIEAREPDAMVHWARMMRDAHAERTVVEAVDAICAMASWLAEGFPVEVDEIVEFLQLVQARVRESLRFTSGAVLGDLPIIESVLAVLRGRDEGTYAHSRSAGAWAYRICEKLGIDGATRALIVNAALLHDVGKIATPDAVLFKDGPLNDDEWRIMAEHAAVGAEMLAEIPMLARYAAIVRAHHERLDGRGYPDRLSGEEIPLVVRVVSVADAFAAMTDDRPYRAALSYGEAIRIMREGSGTQWDPRCVEAMIAIASASRSANAEAMLAIGSAPDAERRVLAS
jgi:putative nucleotidyltransferase with HDIG domain